MRFVFIVGLLLAVLLAACGPSATPEPQVIKETVEVVVTQEVEKRSS